MVFLALVSNETSKDHQIVVSDVFQNFLDIADTVYVIVNF